jgi:hypothetical protein
VEHAARTGRLDQEQEPRPERRTWWMPWPAGSIRRYVPG